MSDDKPRSPMGIPEATVKHKSNGISAVWVIPIIAALIGGWLVFKTAAENKAAVEVTFKTAEGLVAGKTVVKLRNIEIGKVTEVKFSKDLSQIVVTLEFNDIKQEKITDTARFWVVKPEITIGGVSGLDTLLSGAYIELDPGDAGVPTVKFTGMEKSDIHQKGNPGTRYILSVKDLGSLSRGSPVKFRDVDVGLVTTYKLVEDHSHVEVEIFIRAPHDQYVKQDTRFWNASGLELEVGAEGIKLGLDSLASLMAGGVSFSSENASETAAQAPEKTIFTLYADKEPNFEEELVFKAPMKLYFEYGVSGLEVGAPVEFKGLRVGTVSDISVDIDITKSEILTYAMIDVEPDRLPTKRDVSNLTREQRVKSVHKFFEIMVGRGLRAQLKSGSLITGQSLVTLDFFPPDKKVKLTYEDGLPILPTTPETLAGIMARVEKFSKRIEALPLEAIGQNIAEATAALTGTADALSETAGSVNGLVKSLNAAEGGMLGLEMRETLVEISKTARSVRSMSEYLERHPEALLTGKKQN